MIYEGQRVITSHGTVAIVAFVKGSQVWAFTSRGLQPITVRGDAWGGEHDLGLMNAA